MTSLGTFYGIGVGPGQPGLIPVAAWEVVQKCDAIFVPRATSQDASTAKQCLPENHIAADRFHEIEFDMSRDHSALESRYTAMAATIAELLRQGKSVAYLTLGDSMTYSTFNYALRAVRAVCPEVPWKVFPGVTSFAALAAATGQTLGEGKERVQILPCPEDMEVLSRVIGANHLVVLMKVGHRLPGVLALLQRLNLLDHSVLGSRVGMPDEALFSDLRAFMDQSPSGYLATLLIRNPEPTIL